MIIATLMLVLLWGVCMWFILSRGRAVSALHGWMVGLSYFVVLPLTIIVLNGGYTVPAYYGVQGAWGILDLRDDQYLFPYLVVWGSLLLVAMTAAFLVWRSGRSPPLHSVFDFSEQRIRWALFACAGITIFDIAASIYLRGGIKSYFALHWYVRHEQALETYGELFVLYLFLGLGLQLTLTAVTCVCVLHRMGTGRGGGLLALAVVVMLLTMVASGNRIFIALFLLFVGAAAIFHRKFGLIARLGLLAPVLVVVFAIWAQVRGALSDPTAAIQGQLDSASAYEGNDVLNRLIDVTEGTNIIFLLNIVKDFGDRYEFLAGATFLKSFTFWIPRSVYPDKPEGFTVIAARLYEPGVDTSINSTILGELYANFGLLSLILLPVITALVFAVDRWMIRRLSRNFLFTTALFLAFAWMARASFSDNLLMIAVCVMLIALLRLERGLLVLKHSGVVRQYRPLAARIGRRDV